MKNEKVALIIEKMISLLQDTSSQSWVDPLTRLRSAVMANEKDVARNILRLYGGLGSLNDVVLYSRGSVLVTASNEFASLSEDLFEECKIAL